MRVTAAAFGAALLIGCSSNSSSSGGGGEGSGGDGGGQGCPATTIALVDGTCREPGMAADTCVEGFAHDGENRCLPTLPSEPCPHGTFAVPGETACHEVAPCEAGPWGAIPTDANTQYVDASFVGTSDGTSNAPWTTLGEAVAAAANGAVIAMTDGTYVGDVEVSKPVAIWGRCPAAVTIVGTDPSFAALFFSPGATGASLHSIGVSGPGFGVVLSGSQDVVFDRIWVHDTAGRAMNVEATLGATSFQLTGSLLEVAAITGLHASGAEGTVVQSAIRDVVAGGSAPGGRGINVQDSDAGTAAVTLQQVVIERVVETALFVRGSTVGAEGLVLRDVAEASSGFGNALAAEASEDGLLPAAVTLQGALMERITNIAVKINDSVADLSGLVVRDVSANAAGGLGRGVNVESGVPGEAATLILRDSVIERVREAGVLLAASTGTVEGVAISEVLTGGLDQGRGLVAQDNNVTGASGLPTLVAESRVSAAHGFGMIAVGAPLSVRDVLILDTLTTPVGLGDAVAAAASPANPATVTLERLTARNSGRAGLTGFGATMSLLGSRLLCQEIDLNGVELFGSPFTFEDGGDNLCGCDGELADCKLLSNELEPPSPL